METLLGSLIAPGIVAALVAYVLNRRLEVRRQRRDYIGNYIDDARDEVREAAVLGVKYHAHIAPNKREALAAEIAIFEADLRSRLADIREDQMAGDLGIIQELKLAEEEFVGALTGGQFGSANGSPDPKQVSRTVAAATLLRRRMRELRLLRLDGEKPNSLAPVALLIFVVSLWIFLIGVSVGQHL